MNYLKSVLKKFACKIKCLGRRLQEVLPIQLHLDTFEDSGFKLGQSVVHQKFGEGVVLNYEGNGAQSRIQVNFAEAGSKWLVVAYANLKAL